MFRRVRVFEVACVVIGLVALCSAAQGDVIGPGNYSGAGVDTANEMITDWSHPLSLAAGTYNATTFSYDVADGWGQGAITVQPFLATGTAGTFDTVAWSGTVGSYTPILVGNAISFSANYSTAPFADYAFPGSGSFTLDAPTTVYAGFWASGGETPYAPPGIAQRSLVAHRRSSLRVRAGVRTLGPFGGRTPLRPLSLLVSR